MPVEIEIKARLDDLPGFRSRLEAEGATLLHPEALEDNWLLDHPDHNLIGRGETLRVRSAAGRGWITWKGLKTSDGALRRREELEVGLDDPATLLELLARLGFTPRFRYQKYRATWTLGRVQVMIDRTPAGDFAEIEGDEDAVRATAERLELGGDRLVAETYPALLARWLAGRGSSRREALFEPDDGRG